MSDDPPKPKPEPRVPSFDELKGPRRPMPDPGPEEKTTQISPELLKKALAQSAAAAPANPAVHTSPTVQQRAVTSGTPPVARVAPPPPGGAPKPPVAPPPPAPGSWNPTAATAPLLPMVKTAPPPPGAPRRPATERMEPITPDAIPNSRASGGRAAVPMQVDAPARPDPSLHQTLLSKNHQTEFISEPTPSAPTVMEPRRVLDAKPSPPRAPTTQITQPNVENPFVSRRAEEPPSGERVAAPMSEKTLRHDLGALPDPPTRNERSGSGPRSASLDIEADILSEVHKLQATTDPGRPGSMAADPVTKEVEPVEVLAHPASVGRRLLAYAVDAVVLSTLSAAMVSLVMIAGRPAALPPGLGLLDQLAMRAHDSPKLVAAAGVLCLGIVAAYTAFFAVSLAGRTPGRLVAGVRLVTRRGGPPGTGRAVLRAVFALVSFALGLSGFWLGLFDRRAQTLHDKLCSTFVVRLGPTRT